MGNAAHIGRLGALAVALGVGSAIASMPCIAAAQPSDSPSSTSGATAGPHTGKPARAGDRTTRTAAKATAPKVHLTAVKPMRSGVPVLSGAAKLPTPDQALQTLTSALELVGSELQRITGGRESRCGHDHRNPGHGPQPSGESGC